MIIIKCWGERCILRDGLRSQRQNRRPAGRHDNRQGRGRGLEKTGGPRRGNKVLSLDIIWRERCENLVAGRLQGVRKRGIQVDTKFSGWSYWTDVVTCTRELPDCCVLCFSFRRVLPAVSLHHPSWRTFLVFPRPSHFVWPFPACHTLAAHCLLWSWPWCLLWSRNSTELGVRRL